MDARVNKKYIHAVVGIIKKENKFLIAERPKDKPYSGYWEFPGGKIEPNETAYTALVRELKEEIGIDIISAIAWFKHSHDYPDKKVFLECYLVQEFLGEPKALENQTLYWATLPEIHQLPILEGNWMILEKLKQL